MTEHLIKEEEKKNLGHNISQLESKLQFKC